MSSSPLAWQKAWRKGASGTLLVAAWLAALTACGGDCLVVRDHFLEGSIDYLSADGARTVASEPVLVARYLEAGRFRLDWVQRSPERVSFAVVLGGLEPTERGQTSSLVELGGRLCLCRGYLSEEIGRWGCLGGDTGQERVEATCLELRGTATLERLSQRCVNGRGCANKVDLHLRGEGLGPAGRAQVWASVHLDEDFETCEAGALFD